MATHAVNSQIQQEYVEANITENYLLKRDEHLASSSITQENRPTDNEFFAQALSNIAESNARPLSQRTNYEVFNVNEVEVGVWTAQINQFNVEEWSRVVDLRIPIEALPAEYTDTDIITWGRANSLLRLATDIY